MSFPIEDLDNFISLLKKECPSEDILDPTITELLAKLNQWYQDIQECKFLNQLPFTKQEMDYLNSPLLDLISKHEMDDPPHCFEHACQDGDLQYLKWLIKVFPNDILSSLPIMGTRNVAYNPSARYNRWFYFACIHNHLNVAQWLLEQFPEIDPDGYSNVLTSVCPQGLLDMAKWLYAKYPNICVQPYIFETTCAKGHIETAKWLLTIKKEKFIPRVYIGFSNACRSGHLELAQWLLYTFNLNPQIDAEYIKYPDWIEEDFGEQHILRQTLYAGQYEVAKWLISLIPELN